MLPKSLPSDLLVFTHKFGDQFFLFTDPVQTSITEKICGNLKKVWRNYCRRFDGVPIGFFVSVCLGLATDVSAQKCKTILTFFESIESPDRKTSKWLQGNWQQEKDDSRNKPEVNNLMTLFLYETDGRAHYFFYQNFLVLDFLVCSHNAHIKTT
jgi:hypothetical protein